ncbi:LPS translocon maturation chaperone LptM [Acidithiobacillus sp.]
MMRWRCRRQRVAMLLVLGVSLALAACGRKTPLMLPKPPVPAAAPVSSPAPGTSSTHSAAQP